MAGSDMWGDLGPDIVGPCPVGGLGARPLLRGRNNFNPWTEGRNRAFFDRTPATKDAFLLGHNGGNRPSREGLRQLLEPKASLRPSKGESVGGKIMEIVEDFSSASLGAVFEGEFSAILTF
jgi:hypothetical protein